MQPLTPADINRRSHEFWTKQNRLLVQRLSDEAIRTRAFAIIDDQTVRGVPAKFQKCLNAALEDAAGQQQHFVSALARKGGHARKKDALQLLIEEIVSERPNIAERELLAELESQSGFDKLINEITDGFIHFDHHGKSKQAKSSGLKDRLSRAKKQTRSR